MNNVNNRIRSLLLNHQALQQHIQKSTSTRVLPGLIYPENWTELVGDSAVLFLLGFNRCANGGRPEPCLILNKRSDKVRQPGDLCCPGGGIMPTLDPLLGRALTIPGFPMGAWPPWKEMLTEKPGQAHIIRSLFSTSLRESFEEMRLIPFDVKLLGPLPSQELVMFKRIIYPLAGWVGHQKRFFPNWEVEKIVYIPLRKLLNPKNYVRYQYSFTIPGSGQRWQQTYDSPCYLHETDSVREVLWGATCRITLKFLKIVFDFDPPDLSTLPLFRADMKANYADGTRP